MTLLIKKKHKKTHNNAKLNLDQRRTFRMPTKGKSDKHTRGSAEMLKRT